jgi:prepilin-type processing-associated H-X9-DG protein
MGLMQYGQTTGYLCSGAFDWKRDGDSRKVGWVADQLNGEYVNPGKMLCHSNVAKFSEKWNDICSESTVSTVNEADKAWGELKIRDGAGGWVAGWTPALSLADAQQMYNEGYNTNYAASWYLVRTDMSHPYYPNSFETEPVKDLYYKGATANAKTGDPTGARSDTLGLATTMGPLSLGLLDSLRITTTPDKIPLLADASLGDSDRATLTYDLGPNAQKGDKCSKSYSSGPVPTPAGWLTAGSTAPELCQNFLSFAPVHGTGKIHSCNVLFADGHVSNIVDINGDSIIGFSGDGFTTPTDPGNPRELDLAVGMMFVGRLRCQMQIDYIPE